MDLNLINSDLFQAIAELMNILDVSEAVLFGSTVTSALYGIESAGMDCDLAIIGDADDADEARNKLLSAGFHLTSWRRYFQMNRLEGCYVLPVEHNGISFDIAFVQSFENIGIFTVESPTVHFPSLLFHNAERAKADWGEGRLILRLPLEEQSPFLLLGRCLVIAEKYGIPLTDPANRHLLFMTANQMASWTPVDGLLFAGQDIAGYLSKLLKSIVRASEGKSFLLMLLEVGIVEMVSPILASALGSLAAHWPSDWRPCSCPELVSRLLAQPLSSKERIAVRHQLQMLVLRSWEKDAAQIARFAGFDDLSPDCPV